MQPLPPIVPSSNDISGPSAGLGGGILGCCTGGIG